MALLDLWVSSQDQLKNKQVQQIIAIAGDGKLRDGREASGEFRTFLAHVPSSLLANYAEDCLNDPFPDSGHALQDVVNEVGSRLGFVTTFGRYQGTSAHVGFDGLWRCQNGHSIVVEVKTTDAYRIHLDTVANYGRALIAAGTIAESASSSILIVVGRQDTGDLEAQIRGSRHAWDVRLISVRALLRLVDLKEQVEDPNTIIRKIHEILVPREFTRLDDIVDMMFSTAEDIKQDAVAVDMETAGGESGDGKPKITPVAFHDPCVERIEKHLGCTLVKQARATFASPDSSLAVVCAVSREYLNREQVSYWFAFHPHQKEFLSPLARAHVAFGCGSEDQVLLIPLADFAPWLDGMNVTQAKDRSYWHVSIFKEAGRFVLHRKRGQPRIDLSSYLLPHHHRSN